MKLLTGRRFPLENCLDEMSIVQINKNLTPPSPLGNKCRCMKPLLLSLNTELVALLCLGFPFMSVGRKLFTKEQLFKLLVCFYLHTMN